jgi:hypothetical protein
MLLVSFCVGCVLLSALIDAFDVIQ